MGSLAGIFGGIRDIYRKRVDTDVGLLETPRKVFTGYTAQLWGGIELVSGCILLLIYLEFIDGFNIVYVGIFYLISYLICGIIIQPIENRLT